jgi:hypothetical protein
MDWILYIVPGLAVAFAAWAIHYAATKGAPALWAKLKGWWTKGQADLAALKGDISDAQTKVAALEQKLSGPLADLQAAVKRIEGELATLNAAAAAKPSA